MPSSDRADGARVLDAAALRAWPLPDADQTDKHGRGTVLVVGGAPSTPGSVLLAGLAALRMGAGRLRIATSVSTAPALGVAVPESMVVALRTTEAGGLIVGDELSEAASTSDVVVVGPGMVDPQATAAVVRSVVAAVPPAARVVLDALALGVHDGLPGDVRERLTGRVVMTPNREEAARLAGVDPDSSGDDGDVLRDAARRTCAVLSSFGTVQVPDGRAWRTAASAGLGTSGAGDVLAGLVGGAACRTDDVVQAACWATFAHMEAGRRAAVHVGAAGYLARELLDEVPSCLPSVPTAASDDDG